MTGLLKLSIVSIFSVSVAAGAGPREVCSPTESDYLGPYYVSGTVDTENLNRQGKPGEPLLVTGRLLSAAVAGKALPGARIEVWQTDGAGNYFPQGDGDVADYQPDEIDLRGTVTTDGEGRYLFKTVVPGNYFPRPRHFHYRITAAGHQTLVTQLYITGDGHLGQPGEDCRHAPLVKTATESRYVAPDIFLSPADE